MKLQLDWPDEIRDFFSIFNVLGLSLSSLSPRCVLSNWTHLHKVVMINCTPPIILTVLLLYTYFKPSIRLFGANVWLTTITKLNLAQHLHDDKLDMRGVKVSSHTNTLVNEFDQMNQYIYSIRRHIHFPNWMRSFLD